MITNVSVGPLKLQYMGESKVEATPIGFGESLQATQHLAFITGPDQIALETAYLILSSRRLGKLPRCAGRTQIILLKNYR